jgi:hypothetical protein
MRMCMHEPRTTYLQLFCLRGSGIAVDDSMLFIGGNFCVDDPPSPPRPLLSVHRAAGRPRQNGISSHGLNFRSLHAVAPMTHLQARGDSDGDMPSGCCAEVLAVCGFFFLLFQDRGDCGGALSWPASTCPHLSPCLRVIDGTVE